MNINGLNCKNMGRVQLLCNGEMSSQNLLVCQCAAIHFLQYSWLIAVLRTLKPGLCIPEGTV